MCLFLFRYLRKEIGIADQPLHGNMQRFCKHQKLRVAHMALIFLNNVIFRPGDNRPEKIASLFFLAFSGLRTVFF